MRLVENMQQFSYSSHRAFVFGNIPPHSDDARGLSIGFARKNGAQFNRKRTSVLLDGGVFGVACQTGLQGLIHPGHKPFQIAWMNDFGKLSSHHLGWALAPDHFVGAMIAGDHAAIKVQETHRVGQDFDQSLIMLLAGPQSRCGVAQPQKGPHPRQEFIHNHRLGNIIIRACRQASDFFRHA